MSSNQIIIQLTSEQQKQIKEKLGKNVTALNVDLAAIGSLSESELDQVSGGVSIAYEKIE